MKTWTKNMANVIRKTIFIIRRLLRDTSKSLDASLLMLWTSFIMNKVGGGVLDVSDFYGYDTIQNYIGYGIGSDCTGFSFLSNIPPKQPRWKYGLLS